MDIEATENGGWRGENDDFYNQYLHVDTREEISIPVGALPTAVHLHYFPQAVTWPTGPLVLLNCSQLMPLSAPGYAGEELFSGIKPHEGMGCKIRGNGNRLRVLLSIIDFT